MSTIDANGTTFTFDGTEVGGIEVYEFLQGQPREVVFRPVSSGAAQARPGQPDFGRCVLRLYRDKGDAGQVKLQASLRNREIKTCVLTYKDGTSDTFSAFCMTLPVVGSKGAANPVNLSNCILRISGTIS